ncbi:DUF4384 domain-containing protein [Piscinibacter sp. HJYY11]|uniref:DUF4384 domain-containing protein n=1 Tax=Piscinibacter sp. HJYY11 TaxID=2801333 RepID=UPI00191EFD65|nr:DUF4384 domain-containing protein [Piscinibacter sp. HJYY11]MBL0729299.1 DUF4384 domain-containing protein [Piscinibacter sp. HJYY11]
MRRLTLIAAACSLLAACTSPSKSTLADVRQQANPTDRAQRTITSFTPALRCMDELMFRSGTRDVTLMMEELRDATQKVQVSTRDMMTSAISDMTRRSRAVRLSVFGNDQQNLAQLLQTAQKTTPFAVIPEFNLRGTISQLDEDVQRNSASFGLVQQLFGLRFGNEAKFSVLGFDAAVVRTDSFTLVNGVTSKNTTVIAKRDASAGDGQARILGSASVFSFSAARSEGPAQAARNMVELAAIELVGKLIRAPYWQCLGTPDDHPEVQREIEDWFFSMSPDERTVLAKTRMRDRRYFDGALDATRSPGFDQALAAYRRATGLPPQGEIDLAFFQRLVTREVPSGPLATTATGGEAAAVQLNLQPRRNSGQADLQVTTASAGYLYCYAQDPATKAIRRVFPNRFSADPRVEAGQSLSLPGKARFSLSAAHDHACVHAPREVYNDLPPPLRWGDFEDVRLASFDDIRQQFAQASGLPIVLTRAAKPRR